MAATDQPEMPPFSQWGVLEIMGHQRYAGLIDEFRIGGSAFIRVTVPLEEGGEFSRIFGTTSVFSITPLDEALARSIAKHWRSTPLDVFGLPDLLVRLIDAGTDPDPSLPDLD